ncbi:MAG: adenylate/guanylate cyclase domain-containing protein [Lentisphaerota bacterium]
MSETAPKTVWQAILFADVTDSSRLYATYGDGEARRIVSCCLSFLAEIVAANRGRVVKSIGDEVMCVFPDADAAATSAIQMQAGVRERVRNGQLHSSLSIRVGFHGGPVLQEGSDVFGDAVNLAARMAGMSKAHQVLTTRPIADSLGPLLKPLARFMDQSVIKGQHGEFELYELVWDTEEATMAAEKTNRPPAETSSIQMRLRLQDREWVVDRNNPCVSIGRNRQCDVVIQDSMISRLHAKVDYHKGRFFVSDLSTNGTYVITEEGRSLFARRDQIALEGNGLIGIGRVPEPKDPRTLRFMTCEGSPLS